MLKNYLKIAVRNIKRNKIYSFINIIGLAVGIACTVLILLWIQDELSYDNFHSKGDRIYRIISENPKSGGPEHYAGSPAPLGPALIEEYPEVLRFTRLQAGWSGWHLHYGDKNFTDEKLANADPAFFDIFDFELLQGDPKTVSNFLIPLASNNLIYKYPNSISKTISSRYLSSSSGSYPDFKLFLNKRAIPCQNTALTSPLKSLIKL